MRLIKHAHACVTLEKGDSHFVIDPGTFTPNVAELIANTDTILITHEHFDHFDHFDEAAITGALNLRAVNPKLLVQIYEVLLSDIGQQSTARIFNPNMLTAVPLTIVPIGDSITI